ncbi:hypothetical protein V9T40_011260 [Parthenolecanium corni]|uniref:Uncharacterized protein n=1 Tax=Parthenolecanium corni TaxID=536013 RepID=A0AAN9T6I8_9HEMI
MYHSKVTKGCRGMPSEGGKPKGGALVQHERDKLKRRRRLIYKEGNSAAGAAAADAHRRSVEECWRAVLVAREISDGRDAGDASDPQTKRWSRARAHHLSGVPSGLNTIMLPFFDKNGVPYRLRRPPHGPDVHSCAAVHSRRIVSTMAIAPLSPPHCGATPAISEAVFSISSKNMKPMHWRMIELVSPVPTHFQITV